MSKKEYFQDYLPGTVCFGCGNSNKQGLQIKSYWDGDIAKCHFQPAEHHVGWGQLTCGGIIATVVDCHSIATAMATAIRNEGRSLASEPKYLFATGSMNIRYLQPAAIDKPIEVLAQVTQIKNEKKYTVDCEVYVDNEKTADAQVIALLVHRSDRPEESPEVFRIND